MTDFVHLHVHTEYSLLDGACRIERLISRVKELGQSAVAITDHGVMYGVMDFYKAAKAEGIKPVIGCELYVAPRTRFDKTYELDGNAYHLVALCKDMTGYKNLMYLCSFGFTEGFYNRPRVDFELLSAHSEGLIILSACLAGEVQQLLAEGNYEGAKACALKYDALMGRGNYYLELQDHGIPEQIQVNTGLLRIADETGIPLVATNDSHYLRRQDADIHDVLLCVQTGKTLDEPNRMQFTGKEFYIKSGDEMAQLFPKSPEAVSNTLKIAEMCNVEFDFKSHHLPRFPLQPGEDALGLLKQKCFTGYEKRYPQNPDGYFDRLNFEIDMIARMGFVDYFLIVGDFIEFARKQGIPVGPGRGSAAGSMVSYCLYITDVDPMKYSLYFERFLNPERISMPDIDIDFCYMRRQEVIDYVIEKYGQDCVSQIITFGTMAARASVRDVGRALGMPYAEVDVVAKMIPQELKMTLAKALETAPELKRLYGDDPRVKRLLDTAMELEGMPRNASTHAAGVIITAAPVYQYVPLAKNDLGVVTQYSMTTLEELGLLKMDFLGLRNLTILDDALKLVRKGGTDIDLGTIDYDDQKVYDMIGKGQTAGIFQIESSGMTGLALGMKPKSIEDITALIALFRPGPMASIPLYLSRRGNPDRVKYAHPALESILSVTFGCIVYQEQVMEIFRFLAGYSLGRADVVRRAMSKKKMDVLLSERQTFVFGNEAEGIAGCVASGISEKIANEIFDEMVDFANYAFNKAHALSYAVLSYQTAYLKYYYPKEYMAALLTSILGQSGKVSEYIESCKAMGISLLAPDINSSEADFTVDGDAIRFGMAAVKNVGRGFIDALVKERLIGGKYKDLEDFCVRLSGSELNKRAVENLIKCGAFDSFGVKRSYLMQNYTRIMDSSADQKKRNLDGQFNLFDGIDVQPQVVRSPDAGMQEFSQRELLAMEKETTGLYFSGHPLGDLRAVMEKIGATPIAKILENQEENTDGTLSDGDFTTVCGIITAYKLKLTKKNTNMAYVTIEDLTGSMEMLVFESALHSSGTYIANDSAIIAYGRISAREDEETKLVLEEAYPLTPEFAEHYAEMRSSRHGRGSQRRTKPGIPEVQKPRRTLCLRMPSSRDRLYDETVAVLKSYPGECAVIMTFTDEERRELAPRELWVTDDMQMLSEIENILSKENVVMKHLSEKALREV